MEDESPLYVIVFGQMTLRLFLVFAEKVSSSFGRHSRPVTRRRRSGVSPLIPSTNAGRDTSGYTEFPPLGHGHLYGHAVENRERACQTRPFGRGQVLPERLQFRGGGEPLPDDAFGSLRRAERHHRRRENGAEAGRDPKRTPLGLPFPPITHQGSLCAHRSANHLSSCWYLIRKGTLSMPT